jgi:hypothetical protein
MTAEQARARARECEERANSADDPTIRNINEYLANQWHLLADQLEQEGRIEKSPGGVDDGA